MGKYKTKTIRADLGILTHIPAYSDISTHIQPDIIRHIQAYSEPCVTLTYSEPWQIQNQTRIQNPGKFITRHVFRTLVYSETWLIQNPGLFKTLVYSEPEAYYDPDIFRTQTYLGP